MVERQDKTHVNKVVCSDNGTEFDCMLDYFTSCGTLFQTSYIGTS